jgi:hypothetical protein
VPASKFAVYETAGLTLLEAAEAEPVPMELVAVTVKIYAAPFANPETVTGEDAPEAVKLPGLDVTVYEEIAAPPFEAGAEKLTVAWVLPAVATPIVGASGVVAGVIELEAAEAALAPAELVAVTVKVYAVPFVNPETVIGEDAPEAVKPPELEVIV